jgi:acyl-CoA thioester hydrolase
MSRPKARTLARHLYQCPLRWADMDVYGIVNNVAYLRYLEEARVDLIQRMAPSAGDAFFRGGSVVVRHHIEYRHQLQHRSTPVSIEMWVSELQSATVTVAYEVFDEDDLYATASTVMAPFDFVAGRPRRLTLAEETFFQRYLDDPPEAPGPGR